MQNTINDFQTWEKPDYIVIVITQAAHYIVITQSQRSLLTIFITAFAHNS